MLTVISIILVLLILILLGRQWKDNTSFNNHLLRLIAIGLAPLAMALLANPAVAAFRLLLGIGAGTLIGESIQLAGLKEKNKGFKWLAESLPVIVPLLIFMPYYSYFNYFFGFDKAVFFYAFLVAGIYLILSRIGRSQYDMAINAVLSAASITMLLWMAYNSVNGLT